MKRKLLALSISALLISGSAIAAQPADKGKLRVTSFVHNAEGSYTVELAGTQKTSVWVAQICENSAQYHPVPFGGGTTVPFSSGANCEAYVWSFPDAWTPISDVITF